MRRKNKNLRGQELGRASNNLIDITKVILGEKITQAIGETEKQAQF